MQIYRRATQTFATSTMAIIHIKGAARVTRRLRLTSQSMAMATARRARPVVACVDFDMTMTTRDTISMLFDAARAKTEDETQHATHQRRVEALVNHYIQDMEQVFGTPFLGGENTVDCFDEGGLRKLLDEFARKDLQSILRVIESKMLSGLDSSDLISVGENVIIMDDCVTTLSAASRVCVISSNWSQWMIEEKLRRVGLNQAQVIANELKIDENGVTTGDIHLEVQSPFDKAAFVRQQRLSTQEHDIIFIGDSTNDLVAMLEADIGIILAFAAESTLATVCQQFGIQLSPLSRTSTIAGCIESVETAKKTGRRIVFTANTWEDIRVVLAGQPK